MGRNQGRVSESSNAGGKGTPVIGRYQSLNGAEERGPMGAIVDVPVLGRSVHSRCPCSRNISDGENSSASPSESTSLVSCW